MNEHDFYRELERVPDPPAGIYGSIERALRRKRAGRRAIWALAATLLIAVVSLIGLHAPDQTVPTLTAEERQVLEELRIVQNFLFGETIEEEIEAYALMDLDAFTVSTSKE
jgi:hypothetical protein